MVGYLSRIFISLIPGTRYSLENELESMTVKANRLSRDAEKSADLWDRDAFEHDMVLIRQEAGEVERFIDRLRRKGLERDANRLSSK